VGFQGCGNFVFGASVEDFYFGVAFEEVDCCEDPFGFRLRLASYPDVYAVAVVG